MSNLLVYAAFDPFPAPKGAATHIAAFARALGDGLGPRHGALDLVTVAPPGSAFAAPDLGPWVRHHPLAVRGPTVIDRALCFRRALREWWGERRAALVHVRTIFEGYPLARTGQRFRERLVLEVNGLPSIELKYHHPAAADDRELMAKLRAQEEACLLAADLVLTPSPVTAAHLLQRGADPARLRVIPNGVDLACFPWAPPPTRAAGAPLRLLYAGTLSPWQGAQVALEALALLVRDLPAELVLVGPARAGQRRALLERAAGLGVSGAVTLREPVEQAELVRLHHAADAALVPLTACDRNTVQGCCPLKLVEAMAAGTPVVASDLPAVRALMEPEREGLLVRAGSAKAVKDALLRLAADAGLSRSLSRGARARVEAGLTWERAGQALLAAYAEVLGGPWSDSRPDHA